MNTIKISDDIFFLNYLAGLIDGEGCFGNYPHIGGKYRQFTIRIVLEEKDGGVLDLIKEKIGGLRTHRKKQKSWKPHCHEQEEWQVNGKTNCLAISTMLFPYLIIKKEVCKKFINELQKYRQKIQ